MLNQFWLAEMTRQEARIRSEKEYEKPKAPTVSAIRSACRSLLMLDLGSVTEELQRLDINLDGLVLHGKGNFRDLFHPSAIYSTIKLVDLYRLASGVYVGDALRLAGTRSGVFGGRNFNLGLYALDHKAMRSAHSNNHYTSRHPHTMLLRLEDYFHRHNAITEPEKKYTYRNQHNI